MQDKDVHIGDYLWLCFLNNQRDLGYYRIILAQVRVDGHLPPGTKKCYKVVRACGLTDYGAERIMYQMGMGKDAFYTATADELWPTEYEALKHASEELADYATAFQHRASEIPKCWIDDGPIY